jgi:hypothetical protein
MTIISSFLNRCLLYRVKEVGQALGALGFQQESVESPQLGLRRRFTGKAVRRVVL